MSDHGPSAQSQSCTLREPDISNHFTFPIQLVIVQLCGFDPVGSSTEASLTGRVRGDQHAVRSPRIVAKICDALSGKCHTAHPGIRPCGLKCSSQLITTNRREEHSPEPVSRNSGTPEVAHDRSELHHDAVGKFGQGRDPDWQIKPSRDVDLPVPLQVFHPACQHELHHQPPDQLDLARK